MRTMRTMRTMSTARTDTDDDEVLNYSVTVKVFNVRLK